MKTDLRAIFLAATFLSTPASPVLAQDVSAADSALYTSLQAARDAEALRMVQDAKKSARADPASAAAAYVAAMMPARYEVERGDFKTAMDLPVAKSKFTHADALTHYARALSAIRARLPSSANDDIRALNELHKALVDAKDAYWATEVDVQRLTVAAWLANARGKAEEALKLMRSAADLEDGNPKPAMVAARLLPARELLGEMLLDMRQPAEALKELEASRQREPNRFRNFWASAKAAETMGDHDKAKMYCAKVIELAKSGDGKRLDFKQAQALLSRKR